VVGPVVALAFVVLMIVATPGFGTRPASTGPSKSVAAGSAAGRPNSGGLSGWTDLTAGLPLSPGGRYAGGAAWDTATNEAVLFGGLGSAGPLRSTWTFLNGGWHTAGPALPNLTNDPTSRFGAAMAFDPAIGRTVLFGGRDSEGHQLADTWTFDGTNWTNLTDALSGAPPARVNASLGYDPDLGRLVLFGGRSPSAVFADTWEFDGTTWTSVGSAAPNSTNTPPQRFSSSLVYSAAAHALVLFGGTVFRNATYVAVNDTWAFGAGGWQPLHPSRAPSPRASPSATVLPDGDEILFGGAGVTTALADTWMFDGTSWTNLTASLGSPPSARSAAFAVPVNVGNGTGYALFFGGLGGPTSLADTWAVGANGIVTTRGAASPPAVDIGQRTTLTVVAFGPGSGLTYSWGGLPAGCTGSNTPNLACTPTQQGRFATSVTVSDGSTSSSVTVTIALLVNNPPVINAVLVNPFPLVFGSGNVTLSVQASGGTGTLRYSYSGLPPGCTSNDTSVLSCTPLLAGSWTVQATVIDATNGTASRSATVVVNAAGPAKPSHLLSVLASPLGLTAIVVGLGIVLMIVYTVVRRRRSRRPPKGRTGTAPPARPATGPPRPKPASPSPPAGSGGAGVNPAVGAAAPRSDGRTAPVER
jgi:hypothetical protein